MTDLDRDRLDASRLRDDIVALARRLRQSAGADGETWTMLMALGAIERAEGQAMPTQIGSELGLRSSNLAQQLGELEKRGLIQRTADRADKRRVRLSITDAGSTLAREARARRDNWLLAAMRASLSPEEQAQLMKAGELMRRLAASAEGPPPGSGSSTQ